MLFTLCPAPPTLITSVGFMASMQALIVGDECDLVVVMIFPPLGTEGVIPRTPSPTMPTSNSCNLQSLLTWCASPRHPTQISLFAATATRRCPTTRILTPHCPALLERVSLGGVVEERLMHHSCDSFASNGKTDEDRDVIQQTLSVFLGAVEWVNPAYNVLFFHACGDALISSLQLQQLPHCSRQLRFDSDFNQTRHAL